MKPHPLFWLKRLAKKIAQGRKTKANEKAGYVVRSHPKHGQHRYLAYQPAFKKYVRSLTPALSTVFRFLEEKENRERLKKIDKPIQVASGITIRGDLTGSYKGNPKSFLTNRFHLTVHDRDFFVKSTPIFFAKSALERLIEIKNWFAREKTLHGLRVEVIMPHVVYQNARRAYLVTDFHSPESVEQVTDLRDTGKLHQALAVLRDLRSTFSVDAYPRNAFYRARDNTLLLYDL